LGRKKDEKCKRLGYKEQIIKLFNLI